MNKFQKKLLKMNYQKRIKGNTLAEIERFIEIIKKQKDFNKSVSLFKKDCISLFINNRARFNDVCFICDKTCLQRFDLL